MKILAVAMLLAGCAAAPPITKIETVTPSVPSSLLRCAAAPDVPAAGSQAAVARYLVALWQAGQDCRAHVAAIAQVLGR